MKQVYITKLAKKPESATLEFKRSTAELDRAVETLVAFLNAKGGTVLLRNPVIAEVFYRRGLIEKWGRGTQKIVEICRAAGSPEPEFEERAGAVVVRFFARPVETTSVQPTPVLTQRQHAILKLLHGTDAVRPADLLRALRPPVSERTLRLELDLLIARGLVERVGQAKATRYRRLHRTGETR